MSLAGLVLRISSNPFPLIVPAKTVSSACFGTGELSPVIGAWLTSLEPRTTMPSSGIRSPGLTRKREPTVTLAHIIRLVDEAQTRRAPAEQWVERFARVYTPVVLGLALAFLLIPPLVFGGEWRDWFYRSLVLLVIACPCALVISTPVSIVAAMTAAARAGVLVKGGAYIEVPARLRAIAFDKTGTLTRGEPTVVEMVPLGGHDERELLEIVAALESHSNHPLARAIVVLTLAGFASL